jgi:hypothetical protein
MPFEIFSRSALCNRNHGHNNANVVTTGRYCCFPAMFLVRPIISCIFPPNRSPFPSASSLGLLVNCPITSQTIPLASRKLPSAWSLTLDFMVFVLSLSTTDTRHFLNSFTCENQRAAIKMTFYITVLQLSCQWNAAVIAQGNTLIALR